MPKPSFAHMRTLSLLTGRSYGSGTRSHLLNTVIIGLPSQPSSFKREFVTSRCSLYSSLEASQTFRMISATAASSRVDLNASTRWWGRRLTRPTVSIIITDIPSGSFKALEVGSRVAKSLFSDSTPACVRVFIRVDLPALVYPTIATVMIPSFFLRERSLSRLSFISERASFSASILRRI